MAKRKKAQVARKPSKATKKAASKKGAARKRTPKAKTRAIPPSAVTTELEVTLESAVAVPIPSGPDECSVWRRRTFRTRIFEAVATWSGEDVGTLAPNMTLASLAKGTVWNQGQQNRLLQATNAARPFEPFDSLMDDPPGLAAGSTTVDQWEQLAWDRQTPRTPCFGLA